MTACPGTTPATSAQSEVVVDPAGASAVVVSVMTGRRVAVAQLLQDVGDERVPLHDRVPRR